MSDTGLVAPISPDLAAQRGIAQNKIAGEDLWDHTLRSVDAVAPDRPVVRLAALLHDIGKCEELTFDTAIEYSDQGRLVGHVITLVFRMGLFKPAGYLLGRPI